MLSRVVAVLVVVNGTSHDDRASFDYERLDIDRLSKQSQWQRKTQLQESSER